VTRAVSIPAELGAQHPGSFLRLRAACQDSSNSITSINDHFWSTPGGFEISRRLLHPPDCVASEWSLQGKSCAFTLRCEKVALFVVLDTAGKLGPGRFSDGSFTMVPVRLV
jgi:hypothetical protein